MCLKKEKSVSVFLLPGLFVILWRGGFGLGSGRVQAVALRSEQEVRVAAGRARGRGLAPLGCSPMVPQPEMQSRSGDSSQGQLAAAGRQVPPSVRRSRLRMPSQWLGSGSASVRSSMAQADTKGNSRDEKRLSSEVEGLRTRLLTWCFPTWLFSQQPKPRLCGCAAPELPLSLGS